MCYIIYVLYCIYKKCTETSLNLSCTHLQVECQSAAEALEALDAGADIVMLDNFTHLTIEAAALQIKKKFPHCLIEASGVSLL